MKTRTLAKVDVYKYATDKSEVIATFEAGEVITVHTETLYGNCYKVTLPDDKIGYVRKDADFFMTRHYKTLRSIHLYNSPKLGLNENNIAKDATIEVKDIVDNEHGRWYQIRGLGQINVDGFIPADTMTHLSEISANAGNEDDKGGSLSGWFIFSLILAIIQTLACLIYIVSFGYISFWAGFYLVLFWVWTIRYYMKSR